MGHEDESDFMSGGGAPIFKFERVGDKITGEVLSVEKRPETDLTTGAVKTWKDGSTRYQYVLTLQTDARDGEEDDGQRRIFCKNKSLQAIRQAVRDARGTTPVGGRLTLQHHATEPAATRGFSPTKLYRAKWEPMPQRARDEWDDPEPASEPPPQRQQQRQNQRRTTTSAMPPEPPPPSDADVPF